MQHRAPSYRLVVNGTNITPTINGRLIDLTLDETPGDEADTLSITISDHDGLVEIPPKGAEIEMAMGWQGQALSEKGVFIVDEANFSGPPDQISITARSADMRNTLPARKTHSWHGETLGEIVKQVASNNSLEAVVSGELGSINIEHLDQTDESDLNLLNRLAERHDAISAVKAGRLLFTPKGEARTASGNPLPTIEVTPRSGDQYSYREVDRSKYTGVVAFWNNLDEGRQVQAMAGNDERVKRLRATYATEPEAMAAANAELNRLARGEAEFSITLAVGRPEAGPEWRLSVSGLKPQINGRKWVITRASHSLSDSGLTTSINAETLTG